MKISGKKKTVKITQNNFDGVMKDLRDFLILEIERYILKAGNQEKLSLLLGKEESYVHIRYKRAKRGGITGFEKLYRECREKLDGVKDESGEVK